MSPEVISHYEVIKKLGEGGMGEVFLARDLTLQRKVVIKRISKKIGADERSRRRLIREARAASALDHPNICTIYEVGEVEGEAFIVMQYVEGEVLSSYAQTHKVEISTLLEFFNQIAAALAVSHRKGIVHRDIKPQNVMISHEGLVKVLDFGLAIRIPTGSVSFEAETQSFLSSQQTLAGTLPYMSPEQARAEDLDTSSDIFSVGTVMYEFCSGVHPFARQSSAETIAAILTSDPPRITSLRPDLPENLEGVISKCLEKQKQNRFRDGAELGAVLNHVKTEIDTERIQHSKPKHAKPSVRSPFIMASVALLLFAMLAATFGYLKLRRNQPTVKPIEIHSLAVLPLDYRGTDENVSYLSDGLTDSLINSLAELSEVKVIARNSVFRYKGKDIDPQAVGRELNVQALLAGKIILQPDGLKISIELIDARDNSHIWGEVYPFKNDEILRVQGLIAREVSDRLRFGLGETTQEKPPKNYTNDDEAYQLYLKGRYFWNKRTAEDLKKSLEYFDQAIARDPSYALAYTGAADSYVLLGSAGYDVVEPREAMLKAGSAADKALKIDGALAEAHSSAATIKLQFAWDWTQAEAEFQKAIELKPNLANAHYWYSILLMARGRRDESIAEAKKAQVLDPLALIVNVNVARAYYFARQYDEAIATCKRVIDLDNRFVWAHYILGSTYAQKGMYKEAIEALQKCLELSNGNASFLSALAYTYALEGNRSKAATLLKGLRTGATNNHATPADIATIYLGLGDKQRALDFLEAACEERSNAMLTLKVGPVYEALRGEKRYAALLDRIGLGPEG